MPAGRGARGCQLGPGARRRVGHVAAPDRSLESDHADPIQRGGADARIRAIADRYETAGVAGTWWLDPESRPADLGDRLERMGLDAEELPAMRIDSSDVPDLDLPAGATLSWVSRTLHLDRPHLQGAHLAEVEGVAVCGHLRPLLYESPQAGSWTCGDRATSALTWAPAYRCCPLLTPGR